MASSAALQPEPAPITACTVSRDVQNFDLLIDDMESELGESWGDLGFEDARTFLTRPEAGQLEFIAIAIDNQDEEHLPRIGELIAGANSRGIKVVLIAEEVSPASLHRLLRMGAAEFIPYPLPDGELHSAIGRMRAQEAAAANLRQQSANAAASGDHKGIVLPVHGLAGGTGATTLAVNLAWELANISGKDAPSVCLMDLDLQFGSASTYLDLPRKEIVYEILSDIASLDGESFMQALQVFNDRLHVLSAPNEILPLDLLGPEDVEKLISVAGAHFDYVVIDMPSTLVAWTETVLHRANVYFATMELDMRSAQNALRMIRALKSEDLPLQKLRYVLNRAPKFSDISGKGRVKRLSESLDIDIEIQIPDGGKPVSEAGDHGLPLAETAAKNPLRKEIRKLAASVHEVSQAAATAR